MPDLKLDDDSNEALSIESDEEANHFKESLFRRRSERRIDSNPSQRQSFSESPSLTPIPGN